jgi:hypothetical protein
VAVRDNGLVDLTGPGLQKHGNAGVRLLRDVDQKVPIITVSTPRFVVSTSGS